MIGAANIYGFIPEACEIIRLDGNQVSKTSEGSGGAVTREVFIAYFKEKVVPIIGDYSKGEMNSIVILDNTSLHRDPEIEKIIHNAKGYLFYTAPIVQT